MRELIVAGDSRNNHMVKGRGELHAHVWPRNVHTPDGQVQLDAKAAVFTTSGFAKAAVQTLWEDADALRELVAAARRRLDEFSPTDEQVREVACLFCGAEPGKPCVRTTGTTEVGKALNVHHATRTKTAREVRERTHDASYHHKRQSADLGDKA